MKCPLQNKLGENSPLWYHHQGLSFSFKETTRGCSIKFPFNPMLRRQKQDGCQLLVFFCIFRSAWVSLIWKESRISIFESFCRRLKDRWLRRSPSSPEGKSVWYMSYSPVQITHYYILWNTARTLNWWGCHLFVIRGKTDEKIDCALTMSV